MPIDPQYADDFDPVNGVPTVSQLLAELAEAGLPAADAQVLLNIFMG